MIYFLHQSGDINNDGFPDAIIGYQFLATRFSFYVYYGDSRYASPGIQEIDNTLVDNTYRFKVTIDGSLYLIQPKGVGDVNNDGINDLIVKVSLDSQDGHILTFVIYGVEGTRADITLDNNSLDPNFGFSIISDVNNESINNEVAGFGDFNGDGIDDIALSINGGVAIVYGKTGNREDVLISDPSFSTLGKKILDLTENGNQVSSLDFCDVNKDGFADLIIGQTNIDSLYVIYGTDDSSTLHIS